MGLDRVRRPHAPLSLARIMLGDREAAFAASRQQFGAGAEGIGNRRGLAAPPSSAPSRTTKPPPTESQVSSASVAPAASLATRRSVLGWRGVGVRISKAIAVSGSKAMRRLPASGRRRRLANLGDERFGGVGVDRLRLVPAEAEDDRLVGRMALAGEGKRAEQRDGDGLDPIDRVLLRQARRRRPRRPSSARQYARTTARRRS